MGVYQRDGRFMVYWNENGKRHDKSFGRGDDARLRAEAFDLAIMQAKEKGRPALEVEIVTVGVPGVVQSQAETAAVAPVGAVEANVAPVAPLAAPVVSVSPAAAPSKGLTFGQLSMMYLDHLRVSGRTEKHIASLENLLKRMFFDILGKDTPVAGMTYLKDIVPFIRQMQGVSQQTGKPRSQASVNRYCDYVDAIFNFGMEMELISKSPMKGRKKAKEQPRDVQIGIDDLKRIMDHAESHIRWAMEVCFNLGTRPGPSELFALRWEHVDFDAGTVRIYATKTKTFRTVPVTESFLIRLREMRDQSQSGFIVEYEGKPLTTIRRSFNTACEKAGITVDVRMYDLRHLFATTMLANGADLAAVSKLMGHSTVKMTADVYYHYLEGEKEKAVGKLPSLARV
ncbi:tyrosine-type recombinase/integrase [Solidesulfovibrio magneticus]|nr:tyrosine-type recombinase/integrase [Solidesulfovibrio magneticus]